MKGKVVLVTGANGGLGTYVTQAFLDARATVVGTSRKIQQSDFNNPNFTALPAEISTREGAQALVDQVVARFGRLDVLAHTVGGFAGGQSIADTDEPRRTGIRHAKQIRGSEFQLGSELWSAAQHPDRCRTGRPPLDKVPGVVPYVAALEKARGCGAPGTCRQRATSAGNAAFHVSTPG